MLPRCGGDGEASRGSEAGPEAVAPAGGRGRRGDRNAQHHPLSFLGQGSLGRFSEQERCLLGSVSAMVKRKRLRVLLVKIG